MKPILSNLYDYFAVTKNDIYNDHDHRDNGYARSTGKSILHELHDDYYHKIWAINSSIRPSIRMNIRVLLSDFIAASISRKLGKYRK